MRAVIKGISNDIVDIETFCPGSIDNFSFESSYLNWAELYKRGR